MFSPIKSSHSHSVVIRRWAPGEIFSTFADAGACLVFGLVVTVGSIACSRSPAFGERAHVSGTRIPSSEPAPDPGAYQGMDAAGIPRYARMSVSAQDSTVLRQAYGIENPHRLYISDSTPEGLLKYDTRVKKCRACYVNSFRIGFVSVRRPGESWEQAERRVHATKPAVFLRASRRASHGTADMDPAVQPTVDAMLAAARNAGFDVRVIATYRSPVREAYLFSEGGGQTYTLTSNHSYGRALDVAIDDGNPAHSKTRRDWIAFRRWLQAYATHAGKPLRLLGRPDRTWDWGHIDVPSASIGFHTIQEAVARGRTCLHRGAPELCDFLPHLPKSLSQPPALQR